MKNNFNQISNILKVVLFTMFCMLCLVTKNVYADDVVYSTEGGTWTKVNDTTFTMDKDGDGTTDVALVKNGNEWQYVFTVADDKATYYGWEENVPEGYEVVGRGTRANPAVSKMEQYSHTPNVSDDGTQNGNYANNLNLNEVVTLPDADKVHVKLTYGGESASYDYVCVWKGAQPNYTASNNSSSAISVNGTKKFGGGTKSTVEFDVECDTVTFGYRSDGSGCGSGYGYHAVVSGSGKGITIVNQSIENPAPETGTLELSKIVKGGKNQTTFTKYSHSSNLSDDGTKNGNYSNNLNTNDVVSIPGASKLHVKLTYAGESDSYDYVCAWEGSQPTYRADSNNSSAISVNNKKKFGGGSGTTVEFDVPGDTVTFGFKTDSSGCGNGYGYYAVVTGDAVKYEEGEARQLFKFNVKLSTDDTNLAKMLTEERVFGDTTFKDGEGFVYLAGGESVTLDGIPAGMDYTITEEKNEDYNVSWTGTTGSCTDNVYSGTMAANATQTVECTNTYNNRTSDDGDGGGGSTGEVDTGNLKLVKHFVNISGEKSATLHIAFWNLEKSTQYKYSDGVNEKTFVSDTSGIGDVELAVTGDSEFTFNSLPAGCQYQISENAGQFISSYELSGAAKITQQRNENLDINKVLTTAKETISKDDNIAVTFTNTGKDAPKDTNSLINIHVEKKWVDSDNATKTRPDSITVQLMQDGDIIATATLDEDTLWKTDFTDLDKFQEDGTTECEYTINEVSTPGYKSEITSSISDDSKTKNFIVTNTLINIGNLKVSKTVNGDGADLTQEFPFTVTLTKDGKPLTGTYNLDAENGAKTGTIALDESGSATFNLKHSESILIKDIPDGTKYTVKETIPELYTEANNGEYTGKIVKEATQSVDVVNTYTPGVNLTVSKTVRGNQGSKTKQFKFQITLTGNNIPSRLNFTRNGNPGKTAVKNGIAEFTLGHGDSIIFKNMTPGLNYSIAELDGVENGYTVESTNESGTLDSDKEVSFTNTKNVGVPTAAVTNTAAIAGVVVICMVGVAIMIAKKKKKSKK